MKKALTIVLAAFVLVLTSCEGTPPKKVNMEGDWKYESFVEPTADLTPQAKKMIESIASIFIDCEINYDKEGKVKMTSKVLGSKEGTYTVTNGRLDQQMGAGTQFILHVQNEGEKLAIILNEEGDASVGKIILAKK